MAKDPGVKHRTCKGLLTLPGHGGGGVCVCRGTRQDRNQPRTNLLGHKKRAPGKAGKIIRTSLKGKQTSKLIEVGDSESLTCLQVEWCGKAGEVTAGGVL